MGLNASLPKPTRLLHHIGADQPGDRGVDVHNGAAGEVQRAMGRQQTAAPNHMRNRHVGECHPHHHEDQYRGETNTFRQRPDNQPDGDAGERALEGHVDILIEGAHQRFQLNIFQHHPVKAAEEAAAGAEGQGIAINHPQYADQAKGDNHLSQHGQNVLTADQAAVKQRNSRIVRNRTSAVQIIINALSALSATAGAAIASPGQKG